MLYTYNADDTAAYSATSNQSLSNHYFSNTGKAKSVTIGGVSSTVGCSCRLDQVYLFYNANLPAISTSNDLYNLAMGDVSKMLINIRA